MIAIITEQRFWTDTDGIAMGRKRMGAVEGLAATVACTLVGRAAAVEATGEPILPRQADCVVVPWPTDVRHAAVLVKTVRFLWSTIASHDGVVVYCPGVLGSVAGVLALVRRRPVVVIAVGNPREALAEVMPGVLGHVAKAVISGCMTLLCRRASVARYVTVGALQASYPPGPQTVSYGISDVGALATGRVRSRDDSGALVALTVASLDQPYKGVAELIEAVAELRAEGIDVRLRVAGTGRLRPSLEAFAATRVGSAVTFAGHVTGRDLDNEYAMADFFVLPSWMEGLSRALVEAMAAGLPAVATDVGGARELLEPARIVPPRNSAALASAIRALIGNADAWRRSSAANLRSAQELIATAQAQEPEFVRSVMTSVPVRL